jgi:hypothetical protein
LKKPAVKAVTPRSASPETTASGTCAADWKSFKLRSRPASLNQPFSWAMKIGPDEESRSSAIDALASSSAEAPRTRGSANIPPSAARRVKACSNTDASRFSLARSMVGFGSEQK